MSNYRRHSGIVDESGRVRAGFLCFAIILCCIFAAKGAAYGEGLSLQAVKMPLKNILNDLSQKSGVTLIYDRAWAELPITTQFKNIPLEPALKRIFSNLNHAIIYNPDGTIMIRIYGTIVYEKDSSIGSGVIRSFSEQNVIHQGEGMNPQDNADEATPDDDEAPEESGAALEEASEGTDAVEESSEPIENTEETSDSDETPEGDSASDEIGPEEKPDSEETGEEDQASSAEEDTKEDG
jgi:hypothetical protein